MTEQWLDISGFDSLYQISNTGKVRALDRYVIKKNGHICFQKGINIAQVKHPKGYLYVSLSKLNKQKSFKVHRLVALHFIPNPNNLKEVNHIDGNKENNNEWNLEWATTFDNMRHAYLNNLRAHKLTNVEVLEIFNSQETTKIICSKYNISDNTVYDIKSGKTRSLITGKKYIKLDSNKIFTAKKYIKLL